MTDYTIDKNETLRYLGYRGQNIDDDTARRIEEMSKLCLKVAKPAYRYEKYDLKFIDEGVELLGTGIIFHGNDIKSHLTGAKFLYLMAATLGHDCDRTALRLESRSIADAVCFNAASVSLIEAVSDRAQKEINAIHSPFGFSVGGRYSPGYGDFPLTQQKDVLKLLKCEESLGITLTEGYLMLPRKSVTSVIGLYEEKPEERVSCTVCTMREWCEFRKGGDHCG